MARNPIHVHGRLNEAEEAEIVRLAKARWKPGRIALRLNRNPSTVSFAMDRLGLRVPVPRSRDYVRRDGATVRTFTAEEDVFITDLRTQGRGTTAIGRACGQRFGHARSAATIGMRLKKLANLAEAAEGTPANGSVP